MMMPILKTKLFIPAGQPKRVSRKHLVERLNQGVYRKLTLVIAPAGFGKSSLVSDWLRETNRSCAWLSLDENDSDPTRFITYLLYALQTVIPAIEESVIPLQLSPQSPPAEWVLTALINEVAAQKGEYFLVLDDYHTLNAPVIDQQLNFLIEHLPKNLHLVLLSREEPDLPLARLRGQNQVTELHSEDLRFTPSEVEDFFNQVMSFGLNAHQIEQLEQRTEGWIAGLQMAALSIEGQSDPNTFIQKFAGSHQFIIDYLIEEVLNQQSESVREFLFQTAILNRLSGPLCNAITGRSDSAAQLQALQRGGMFIISLDDEQQWYRYHYLITEALRARAPENVPQLHQKASRWYQEQGFTAEAVYHALAVDDYPQASRLIGEIWPTLRSTRQEATLLRWMESLPDGLIKADPNLCLAYSWALLDSGQPEKIEPYLSVTEQTLTESRREDDALRASIANARAYRAMAMQELTAAIDYTQQALNLLAEDNFYERGTAVGLLALAQWATGDLETAYDSFTAGMEALQQVGGIIFMIGGALVRAIIRMEQGRLFDGLAILNEALQASRELEAPLPGTAELYLGCSIIYLEQGELDLAREWLAQGEGMRSAAVNPSNDYLWSLQKARLAQIDGDFEFALAYLDEAERLYYSSPIPNIQPIDAFRARIWLDAGDLTLAQNWVSQQGLSSEDQPAYLQEYRHITLVRVLLANGEFETAAVLLEKLLAAAQTGGRDTAVVEIYLLQALAYHGQEEQPASLKAFANSLDAAAANGLKRVFLNPSPELQFLFAAAENDAEMPPYFNEIHQPAASSPDRAGLVEPLSKREIEVLQLLDTEMSGPEMADHLMVSLNTLRTHTKNIYQKLGVNSRRSAVRKAAALGLIE